MFTLSGYSTTEQIYESSHSVIYRGVETNSNRPVVIKKLKSDYPSTEELAAFKREYEMVCGLDMEGVIKVYDLKKAGKTMVIIMEDFGGQSLADILEKERLNLGVFLKVAIRITGILGQIHQRNIMHKDINPSNIIWNRETDEIKIIDFGISTMLSRESPDIQNSELTVGTLSYMSPEQTGRMNREVDYRTDFYSLGVTFYEMLTEKLPFESDDPMELIHAHLAKSPTEPSIIDYHIPKTVSNIILKLLAKIADDRYQGAFGLIADLKRCLKELQSDETIKTFQIGSEDISERFQIPQKLYGRDKELSIIKAVFDRVCHGGKELILIEGNPGVGKTALAYEMYQPVTEKLGYFIVGGYDQIKKSEPYAYIVQAFRGLVQQLLTENETELAFWKDRILRALGSISQVIIDVIPEIELILGKQPDVPELPSLESKNRFNLVFQNFVRIFAVKGRPLVLFLDDLQWADSSSLNLVELLMVDLRRKNLLILGAYRKNEVDRSHQLMSKIDAIKEAGAKVTSLCLHPLEKKQVSQLLVETLSSDSDAVDLLAEICLKKTLGVPFFLIRFLTGLYKDGLVDFDQKNGWWQWDIKKAQERELTINVVELMVDQIQKLSKNSLDELYLAACIGMQFDLVTLAKVSEKSMEETAADLLELLDEGLIVSRDEAYMLVSIRSEKQKIGNTESLSRNPVYRFQHNRIQQAAYSMIPKDIKQSNHLKIGQLLLKTLENKDLEGNIYEVVNQLNLGMPLCTGKADCLQLAELNLTAGRKAKDAAAFELSLDYLKAGIDILGKNKWDQHYKVTLDLYTEAAESAYLCANFDEFKLLKGQVLQRAENLLDRAKIYELELLIHYAENRPLDAIESGLNVLKLLGLYLPKSPNTFQIFWEFLKVKIHLNKNKLAELSDAEMIQDPKILAIIRILDRLGSSSYFAKPKLLPIIIFKYVLISLKYGYSPITAFGFAGYGMILSGGLGKFDEACLYGQLALSMAERPDSRKFKARIWFIVESFIQHWKYHLRESLQPILQAYQTGLENGDIEYAAFSAYLYCVYLYFIGEPLKNVAGKMSSFLEVIRQFKQQSILNILGIYVQTIYNLSSEVEDPHYLAGSVYDETLMFPKHVAANDQTALFCLYSNKMFLYYLFGNFDQAIICSEKTWSYIESAFSSVQANLYYFYDSLIRLAAVYTNKEGDWKAFLRKVSKNQKKLKKWADHAPMNFLHRWHLVEAERCRVLGKHQKSLEHYDLAISVAAKQEYIQDEALANELAAKYWLERGKHSFAMLYMKNALYLYQLWGAIKKVNLLKEEFHFIFESQRELEAASKTSSIYKNDSINKLTTTACLLDAETIMKASQVLTKEVRLDRLLENIVRLVIENAGATKGTLIIDDDGSLQVQAEGVIPLETIRTMINIPVYEYNDIPISVVNFTARSLIPVVINDALTDKIYAKDAYIISRKPKSVLCTPIIHLGKLLGILYLENDLTIGAFTPDRIEILKILSSQAAISMENARFYNSLMDSEKKFRTLYERSIEGIFQTEVNGRIISLNPALARMMGYDSIDNAVSNASEFSKLPFANKEDQIELSCQISKKGQVIGFETQMQQKNGKIIWVSVSAQAILNPDGSICHYEGSMLDVTERKQKEEAERLRHMAEQATKAKSEFLANMSHEIRTPMNAILGMAELLSETDLTIDQKDYVQMFQNAGEELLNIINDILDFSKIEASQVSLEYIPFDLNELAENVIKVLSIAAHDKGLELVCRISPELNPFRMGDPGRLRQIFINLVGNAIKFTLAGEVVLEIISDPNSGSLDALRFCIRDTGIGILPERQDAVFESFAQADSSITREFGGTGLGLTISKRLVQLMGGQIWIESEVGKGSEFIFTLDLPQTDPLPSSKVVPPDDLKDIKMLVVDDSRTNRLILLEHLHKWGALGEEAENGERALTLIKQAEKMGSPYRIVLLDYNMPMMNGFQTAEKIDTLDLSETPLFIMLTSTEGAGRRIANKKTYLNGYVVKPVKRDDLLSAIHAALGRKVIDSESEKKTWMINLPPLRILLAEDIEANWKIVKLMLKNSFVTIDVAENGKIAFEKFKSEQYDAILMDIQMPEMDGFEATRQIRKWESENNVLPIPIIALTAHAFKQKELECYDAGCSGFLTKPLKKKDLIDVLIDLFEAKPATALADKNQDNKQNHPPENAKETVSTEALAMERLYKASVSAFLEDIIPELFDEIKHEMINMRTALLENDFEVLNRLGHGFKGAAQNYELNELSDLFLSVEKAARNCDKVTIDKYLNEVMYFVNHVEVVFHQ